MRSNHDPRSSNSEYRSLNNYQYHSRINPIQKSIRNPKPYPIIKTSAEFAFPTDTACRKIRFAKEFSAGLHKVYIRLIWGVLGVYKGCIGLIWGKLPT